ncbi:MAG: VCBS repeat-containing protein [bacterium]
MTGTALVGLSLLALGCDSGGSRHVLRDADTAWPMHTIDDRFRGSNALGAGDVNGDGLTDYVTNYEFDQRYVIELHPPRDADPRLPWPTVIAHQPPVLADGQQFDSESASLADLDGDGNLDVVATQGGHATPFWEGYAPGVRIVWGPPRERVLDPGAWTDGGRVPATVGVGHLLWQVPFDVNGDGALDVLFGGRVLFDTGARGGVRWLEAPADPARRRDLDAWSMHAIDADQLDGHGFVLEDVDEDGDRDLVDANADFDTPEDQETIHWYENPGPGTPAQRDAWPKHVLYQGPELDAKPQLAVADLDGDGLRDFLTASRNEIWWFRKTQASPPRFERVVIPKPPEARQFQRPIRVGDVDGDGRLDLVGMTVHEDGVLPVTSLSAFWLRNEARRGAAPGPGDWSLHSIKWGSGRRMLIPAFGEKWDQAELTDVDGDGDLDLVANCEEWWQDWFDVLPFFTAGRERQSVAVVWFENRLGEAPWTFVERDGVVAAEAEHASDLGDDVWTERSWFAGAAGGLYLQDLRRLDESPLEPGASRGASYEVQVEGGDYVWWVRRFVPAAWGAVRGRNASDSAWVLVDDAPLGSAPLDDNGEPFDRWTWIQVAGPLHLTRGAHVLTFRPREGGYAFDRWVLVRDPASEPAGEGPPETRSAE